MVDAEQDRQNPYGIDSTVRVELRDGRRFEGQTGYVDHADSSGTMQFNTMYRSAHRQQISCVTGAPRAARSAFANHRRGAQYRRFANANALWATLRKSQRAIDLGLSGRVDFRVDSCLTVQQTATRSRLKDLERDTMTQLSSATPTPDPLAATAHDLLYRKVSWRIIPFLFLGYVVSFLDRINIGFAQLQMKHDLGFSDAMYGLGAGSSISAMCFRSAEQHAARPFRRAPPSRRIMLLWGIASVGMMLVSQPDACSTRCALCSACSKRASFRASCLHLTYWYPPRRRAGRAVDLLRGHAVAGVLGGLVSGWIMRDMAGVPGCSAGSGCS